MRRTDLTSKQAGLRLGVAFAVLIAILVAIGQLDLRRMKTIDETLSDITGSKSTDLELARRALMISNSNNRIVMQIVLVENRRLVEPLMTLRSRNVNEITKLIEESESHCASAQERELLSEVKAARKPYHESCERAIHLLVDERKHDEAETFLVENTLPALQTYHAAWEKFVEFQKAELDEAIKQAQVKYTKTRRLASLLIGLAVALAIVIAIFTTRSTAREIAERISGKNEVSRLNLTLEERVRERTEELNVAIKRLDLQAAALEAAANAILITDRRGTILWVNRAFTTLTGYSKEEALGKNPRILKSGQQSQSFYATLWSTISSGKVWQGEMVNRRKDGTIYTEEVTITPVTPGTGQTTDTCFIAVKQDITERKQAAETLLLKTALLEAQAETTIDGILVVDESDHILLANKQFGRHFEIPDALLGTGDDQLVLDHVLTKIETPDVFVTKVQHLYNHRDEKSRDEFRLTNGKVLDRYSAPLVDSQGRHRGRIWYFRDITDHKLSEERAQFLAYYDALTGLPNRTLLHDRLAKALAGARRQKERVALLFLDLDRFKDINDSLGHSVGDLLLREVATRLKTCGRDQDTIARLGGDEFLILLTHIRDVPDAAVAAERFMDAINAGFMIQGHSLHVGCSLGISIFPEHGADAEALIKNADAAMYRAKESGRNTFSLFAPNMNAQIVERLTLESALRSVLAKEELSVVYQPQMNIATGRITGLEALLRWQNPELGMVPPDRFIRIAENSGLIVPIGEWVLRAACSQARKWQLEGLPAIKVAVNVSAVQFRQAGFCDLIRRVLRDTGLAPQYLELELTESLLLANAELMLSVVQELKKMGLSLAIDDFGTGYSSLSYLRQFRVSKFKIDRSFIRDVATNADDAAITGAIISMAKNLRLKVIAEGVEDEAQMSFLREHHCDEIQGYYFSKPLTPEMAAAKLRIDDESHVRAQASGKTP
jgi:diguanylate cyclase (GGDEF)-like protein/PAS domain S-box-containing protein